MYRTELSVLKGCGSLNQKIVRPSQSIGVPFPHFETCSVFEGMYRNANSSLKSMLMIPALFGKVLPWGGDGSRAIPPIRFASITRYILLGVEHRRHGLANCHVDCENVGLRSHDLLLLYCFPSFPSRTMESMNFEKVDMGGGNQSISIFTTTKSLTHHILQ